MFEKFQFEEQEETERQDTRIRGAILSVDIGSIYTRAVLFDVVDGAYHFIAKGVAATTNGEPFETILIGFRQAVDEVTQATGRKFFDSEDELIIPELDDSTGVHAFIVTCSAGKSVSAILVGLIPEISISSGKRLAESSYLNLVGTIDLSESRRQDYRIDLLLQKKADLIILVGGTEGGAVEPLRKQIETIGLACSMMEPGERPTILYAGNSALQEEVFERIQTDGGALVITAENIRPSVSIENLPSAQTKLVNLFHAQKSRIMPGFAHVGKWTDDGIMPTAYGFGQCIRSLGAISGENVLGIDLGSAATTISAVIDGRFFINVEEGLGMGMSLHHALKDIPYENIERWLTFDPTDPDEVMDTLYNKSIYPHAIPASRKDVEIEYALAREILRLALKIAQENWSSQLNSEKTVTFPTILLSGSTLANPPHVCWSILTLLDILQPIGISQVLFDTYGTAPALGLLAEKQPAAATQILQSDAFLDLGYLVSPDSENPSFLDRINFSVNDEEGHRLETGSISPGSLQRLSVPIGQTQHITLKTVKPIKSAGHARRKHTLQMGGIKQAVIFDTRGRPLKMEKSRKLTAEIREEWLFALCEDDVNE